MPELGTRTDLVRTDKDSLVRRSFKRSCEDRFHKSPRSEIEICFTQHLRQTGLRCLDEENKVNVGRGKISKTEISYRKVLV